VKGLKRSISIFLIISIFLVVIFYLPQPIAIRLKLEIVHFLEFPLKISFFINNQLKNILFYPTILKENISLRERVDILTNENVQLKEVLKENERLNSLLSFKRKSPFRLVAARVIARDTSNLKASITIDKGLNDGIYLEMPVITPAGLVGWVRGVGSSTAQVMLITDVNSKVAALIQDTRLEGIIEGTGEKLCRLKFLEVEAEVKEGQLVVTSGLSLNFPKGLIIGRVEEVIYKKGQVQKIALVKPAVNFNRLEEVLCIDLNH
jgi:rod shape-determining protein MreC